jgi:hypothetical protein
VRTSFRRRAAPPTEAAPEPRPSDPPEAALAEAAPDITAPVPPPSALEEAAPDTESTGAREDERPALAAVAEPEPERREEREPRPVVALALRDSRPRAWNLWDLERLARDGAGDDAARDEERSLLLVYLREFADPGGELPPDFDPLVRESFGELLAASAQ